MELSTGTQSWLILYSFLYSSSILELEYITIVLKLWTFSTSSQLPSLSLLCFTHALFLHCFQWDGSRFSCSGEKKSKAGTAVLSVVQGIPFVNLFSLDFWKIFLYLVRDFLQSLEVWRGTLIWSYLSWGGIDFWYLG